MKKYIFTEQQVTEIIKKYNSGESTEIICLNYNVSPRVIVNLLKENDINIRGHYKHINEIDLITDYLNGDFNADLYRKYNISSTKLFSVLNKNNIQKRGTKHYVVDENFFDEINTERKAYWLGFLYADGYVRNNELRLKLKLSDKGHIEKFKSDLNANYKIIEGTQKIKIGDKIYNSDFASISIYSSKLVRSLFSLGCVNKKTKILEYPEFLDYSFIPHFVRGFFDGDGSISISLDKYINFNIVSGSLFFLTDLKKELLKLNIYDCQITKNKANCWYINWYRRDDIEKIYEYLYNNSTIYLERKLEKFKKLLYGKN